MTRLARALPSLAPSRPRSLTLAISLALVLAACSKGGAPARTYTDTPASFEQFAQDLIGAIKADKKAEFEALARDLAMPDAKAWFTKTFGEEAAPRMIAEYEASPARRLADAYDEFRKLVIDQKRDVVTTSAHSSPDDEMATGHQANALRAMKDKATLYRIDLTRADGEKSFMLWSFVFVDGKFRMGGKMKQVKPSDGTAPSEVDMLGELPMKRARELLNDAAKTAK